MREHRPLLRWKVALREKLVNLVRDSNESGQALEALAARIEALVESTTELREDLRHLLGRTDAMQQAIDAGDPRFVRLEALMVAVINDVPRLRRRLDELRSSAAYESIWAEREPLITVRIATYNLADVLVDRALASVRRQTYERWEAIIVGDGCTDDTERRIASIGDDRIKFFPLPMRGEYPPAPYGQQVAGAPGMNFAASLAQGLWLAPLDDDDEFEPDHIEVLIQAALRGDHELAYGNFRHVRPGEDDQVLGRWPPTVGEFAFQASLYLTALRFFEYDHRSWLLGEPADMVLRRRMMEAGVRMTWVDRVVTTYFPGLLHRPQRDEPGEPDSVE